MTKRLTCMYNTTSAIKVCSTKQFEALDEDMMSMRQKKSKKQQGLFLLMRILLYTFFYGSFFGMLGLNNLPLWVFSRTSGVTLITFSVLLAGTISIYGGYDIGKRKSRPVISSLAMVAVITDLITYLQLEIMNVNDAKYRSLQLFGLDFLLLIGTMIMQIVFIILMTRWGNALYFSVNPPERCCIVASSQEASDHVMKKISRYRLQYDVRDVVDYRSAQVKKVILGNDAVFFAQVPATQRGLLLEFCYQNHKNAYAAAELEDVMMVNGQQVILDDCAFIFMSRGELDLHIKVIKRAMDIVFAAVVLVLTSPVMIAAAIAIHAEDGGSVFFRQKRMTIGGHIFEILKFRTMTTNACMDSNKVSAQQNDQRITRVGAILRKTRMDELPQLFNILKGDMSLVGPRPEMLENVTQYIREFPAFAYRQKMKAGLTGYAQIEGKYNTSARDKLMMDLMYMENYSIWLDVKLLLRTFTVFFRMDSTEGFGGQSAEQKWPRIQTDAGTESIEQETIEKSEMGAVSF